MKIRGYIFDTQQQCKEAIDKINVNLSLPNQKHDKHSNPILNDDGKWFIVEDQYSLSILGDSIEFEFIPPQQAE